MDGQTSWRMMHAGLTIALGQPLKGQDQERHVRPQFSGRKIHNASGGAAAFVMDGSVEEQQSQADSTWQDGVGRFPVSCEWACEGLMKTLKSG